METKYIDLFKDLEDKKDNIYVYCRVSTDLQSTDGQLFEVFNYCKKEKLHPIIENIYVDNGISGYKVSYKNRKIGEILNKCKELGKKDSIIIVPELSRMSRNMFESSEIIKFCMDNKITIVDIKNSIKYDGSLQSQLMSQIYGMVSLLEREAISNRVKAGLKKARNEGKITNGRLNRKVKNKLDGKDQEILDMVNNNISMRQMSKSLNVNISQIRNYLIKNNLFIKYKSKKKS